MSSPDHADLTAIAESFIKPWLEIQSDSPRLQAVEHLLKDSHPPLPSNGQIKTVLKHLNPRKATAGDNIPAWCCKHNSVQRSHLIQACNHQSHTRQGHN